MKTPQYYVTASMLRKLGACDGQVDQFIAQFHGQRAIINAQNVRLWYRVYYCYRTRPTWLLGKLAARLPITHFNPMWEYVLTTNDYLNSGRYDCAAASINAGIAYYHQHKRRRC